MSRGLMNLLRGSKNNWHPAKGVDTTTSSYWLNWRYFLCCLWILISVVMAFYLIMKYERPNNRRSRNGEGGDDDDDDDYGVVVCFEDVWKPCVKAIHPIWLMVFRVFAFFVLLLIIILNGIVNGGKMFYYYTEWTFTLVIIYFGFGSLWSIYGCYRYHNEVGGGRSEELDEAQAVGPQDRRHPCQAVGFCIYVFQIIFQMVAGAVVLTDCIFWFIIAPFLAREHYNTFQLLPIAMHSTNVVFLLFETALNSLRFPLFRIAYFFLWTCVFVIFEWIVHACISLWWPYPFLDLSSPLSPLWYLLVALLQFPSYGIFFLVIKLKNFLLLRMFLRDGESAPP